MAARGRQTSDPGRTAKSRGPGLPTLRSSWRTTNRRRRWLNSPAHRGDRVYAVTPSCREGRIAPVEPVVSNSCAFSTSTRGRGCDQRPAFPAPSIFRGMRMSIARANLRRGNAEAHPLRRHAPRMRGIQYSRGLSAELARLWNTGSPAFAGDDSEIGLAAIRIYSPHTFSSACARSSMMSSACSRPVERRMKPSLMPSSARASGFRR